MVLFFALTLSTQGKPRAQTRVPSMHGRGSPVRCSVNGSSTSNYTCGEKQTATCGKGQRAAPLFAARSRPARFVGRPAANCCRQLPLRCY